MTTSTNYTGQTFDLALGEVYGLRIWRMDDHGRLRALHVELAQPWRPGINEATCHAGEYASGGFTTAVLNRMSAGALAVPCNCPACTAARGSLDRTPPEPGHTAPDERCKCGFYAYTSPATRETYSGKDGYILGLIRGTGRTLIGTKGFRCQKAEIVALLDPRRDHLAVSGFAWQADRLRAVYPDVPLLPSRDQLIAFAPLEPAHTPTPDTDDFWSLP